jgi:hypothetical protein
MESEVREAYERLVTAFREDRWDDKVACFAPEATVVDGAQCFSSLDEYSRRGNDGQQGSRTVPQFFRWTRAS